MVAALTFSIMLLDAARPPAQGPVDQMTWVDWLVWIGAVLAIIGFIVWKRSRRG